MVLSAILPILAFIFATPLAALAVAVGAASVPIIIHLLNRRRFRIVTWAAMRFLLAAQRKNTRRMRLEQLLLLIVRTTLVLLLVLAMASVMPWAETLWFRLFPDSAAFAATSSRRMHKILVLDGSFSMATKVGETTCFDRARAAAAQVLAESPSGDGFSVVLMGAPPRRIVPEPSPEARKVADEITALRLPHGNADLAATLNTIEDMLRQSPGKYDEREVYFFTDLQRSTWVARQNTDPSGTLQKIQGRARTIFVDVGQEGISNTAVTSLTLNSPLATTGTPTSVTAMLHHYGTELRRQARVELLVGKARTSSTEPAFGLRVAEQKLIDLPPGQLPVNFEHKFSTPGEYVVQVRLDNDALELDDVRTVLLTVKETVPVLLVNGKPGKEPYDGATDWLVDALNPFQHGPVPRNYPARPKVVSEAQFTDAGLGDLTACDCVFLCDVKQLSSLEIRRLETHLHRGGGIVFCLGPRVNLEAYNRLLYRNGEGILPARLLSLQQAPENHSFTLHADTYDEPPLSAFKKEQDRQSLRSAQFRQYVRTELAPRGRARKVLAFRPERLPSAAARGPELRPDPSLPIGEAALVEGSRYRGRVVLLTSTVNMDWTAWPISPSFPALLQEVLHFAIAGRLREQAAVVGDPLEEFLPTGGAGLDVALQLPDGRTEMLRTETRDENSVLRWTETDLSGLYRATIGQHPQEFLFAVNVPTSSESQQTCESDLVRTNAAEIQGTYPGWEFQLVTDLRDVVHSGGVAAEAAGARPLRGMGMVLARWLLLTVLVLLLAEGVLAWRFGHYSAVGASEATPAPGHLLPISAGVLAAITFILLAGVLAHAAWTGDFLSFLPESVRNGMEARLGIPPPAAGEGARWHLEFTPFLGDAVTTRWLAGALALAAAALVVGVYLSEGYTAGTAYKLLLAEFRLFLVFLLLTVLLPQVRLWFERQGWPDLVLLIDDSRSMSVTDRYQDPQVSEAVNRLAQEAALTAPQRLQLAQALLTHRQPDWLEDLITRRKVKVHVYHCSARAARLSTVAEADQHDAASQAIQGLSAEGESSQLGTALRQVLNDFRGSSLAAVIMVTDGVTTEGEDLVKVSRYAGQMGVPLFYVGVGDAHPVRDLKLHDLQVEDAVYVNDRVVFEAFVTGQGYGDRTVPVELREKGKDRMLARQMVPLDREGKPVKFRLVHQPTEPGEKTYVLEVPEQDGEKQVDNNRLERVVFVREAKVIKVLYVEGSARYEYRFIKHLLERESDRDKRNKTLDVRVLLLDADPEYPAQDKSALADFPTKEELNAYDVVLFGDVDPKDKRIEKHLHHLADFVRERGGGFLMMAGEQYSPHAYKDSPLRDILPIEVLAPQPEADYPSGFRPEQTPAGRFHSIFRFSPDEIENMAIWNQLAEIHWWSEGYRAKPAAEALLVHPDRPALDSRRTDGTGKSRHPLIVQQFVGAGRSMFFGFNESWRWRLRENELRFNQFWIQTMRYLARSRSGRIKLYLDRQTPYRRGEPIKVTVRFPDDAPPPPPEMRVEVVKERTPSNAPPGAEVDRETLPLVKVEGSRATYEGLLTRTPEGDYRFWLKAPVVSGSKPRAECRVLPPPGEMDLLRMNQTDLERSAEETHGRFYTLADADRLLDELPSGTRVTLNTPQPPTLLWNHFLVFALVLTLLGTEWSLRKRKHLL